MTQLDLQQEEVNRRIAACVNAFEGIPTERIEGKDLGQILAGEMRLHGAGPRNDGGFGFEFSGGVCQLMAEAYAEQFKESGAINYLELLFDHTEIGPLTITMQRVQGLTPAQKLAQAEAERDALQQQVKDLQDKADFKQNLTEQVVAQENHVNALTAENLALHDFIRSDCYTLGDDWHMYGVVTDAYESSPEIIATDAIKRQWMAEGLEEFINDENTTQEAYGCASSYLRKLLQPEEKGQ